MNEQNNIFILIAAMFISMFGSSARILSAPKKKLSKWIFFSSFVVSAFMGLIVGLICMELDKSSHITYALAGVAGYSGDIFMKRLSSMVMNKTLGSEENK